MTTDQRHRVAEVLTRLGVHPDEALAFGEAVEEATGGHPLPNTIQTKRKLTLAVGREVYQGRLAGIQGTMGEVATDLLVVLT